MCTTALLQDLAKGLKEPVPFQPWAETLYKERASGIHWQEDPDVNCLPQALPKVLFTPMPRRIVQIPGIVFFVHEAFNLWWQAFLDGRQLLPVDNVNPAWHGYSTAMWDGDTLVIDSKGFY